MSENRFLPCLHSETEALSTTICAGETYCREQPCPPDYCHAAASVHASSTPGFSLVIIAAFSSSPRAWHTATASRNEPAAIVGANQHSQRHSCPQCCLSYLLTVRAARFSPKTGSLSGGHLLRFHACVPETYCTVSNNSPLLTHCRIDRVYRMMGCIACTEVS